MKDNYLILFLLNSRADQSLYNLEQAIIWGKLINIVIED